MSETERLAAARAFVRSCNVLLKQAALYGLKHSRSGAQLDITWNELRKALADGPKFALAVSTDKLLFDNAPLGTGTAERSLAAFLTAAGIGRLDFHPGVSADEFASLMQIFCGARPADVMANLKPELGKSIRNIRVLEFRVVEAGAAETSAPTDSGDGPALTGQFGASDFNLDILLANPRKLLQLIAPSVSGDRESAGASSATAENAAAATFQEGDVLSVIRWLTRFAGTQPGQPPDASQPVESPSDLQKAVQRILPAKPGRELRSALLLKLAEQVALRAVTEKYERGEFDLAAIQQMLERMNGELDTLRKVLRSREEQMGRAGLAIENSAEVLDRQFWEGIPDDSKRKVLLSPDAWVVPSYNIRSFVEPLLDAAAAGRDLAAAVLRNYCRFLDIPEPDARRKSAAGIGKLADLYARMGYLRTAVQRVGEQLSREAGGELAPLLKDSFVFLGQEAANRADYPALEEWLYHLNQIERREPALGTSVRSLVSIAERVREMVEAAVRQPEPPEAVVEVLKRVPEPAARHIAEEFQRCSRREQCSRVAHLLSVMGPAPIEHLRDMLRSGSASDAVTSVGILTILDPDFLRQQLPARLGKMSRAEQDAAVRQIASGGTGERGRLLLEIIHCLDPLVVPLAIDEIGIAGNVPPSKLMELAQGMGLAGEAPFLQVKAIEALGRLGAKTASPLLTRLVTARSLLSWQHPREVRVVAAQSLQRIDSRAASELLPASGLNDRELTGGPIVATTPGWVRQRKYPRVRSDNALVASLASAAGGPSNLKVEAISLGGGMASTVRDAQEGTDAALDLYIGLRKLQTRVFIRQAHPHEVSFEFVDISLDDRSRLRGFVAEKTRADAPAAKALS